MIRMNIIALALAGLSIGLFGCSSEKTATAPKQEQVTKSMVPDKTEARTANFLVTLSDLQVNMTEDAASKQIVETPRISGSYKITNTSKDMMDIQGITLDYRDASGKQVAFSSGDKEAKIPLSQSNLGPGESSSGSLDATIPRAAVGNLGKVDINLVYVPFPFKQETVTLPEKIG